MARVIKRYAVVLDEEKYAIPVTPPKHHNHNNHNNHKEHDGIAEITDEDLRLSEDGEYGESEENGEADETDENEENDDGEESESAEEIRAREEAAARISAEKAAEAAAAEAVNALIEKAGGQAEEIIGQAKRTAELIVNHALENAKNELEKAIFRGYSDGVESGKNEAMGVISPALDKIAALAESVTQVQNQMLEDFKDEMFNIISEIASKIIHREVDEKEELLVALFSDALKDIKAEHYVTVTVSESQTEFAVRNIDLFKSKVENIEDFKIISDKNSPRGTMIVETLKSVADASCNIQVDKINSILENMKESLEIDYVDAEHD